MIPTMVVLGLVLGRWWKSALAVAAVGWPTLLVATGVMGVQPGLLGASALAASNAAVGVLIHQGTLRAYRHRRRQGVRPTSG